jgi:hypothetical protein
MLAQVLQAEDVLLVKEHCLPVACCKVLWSSAECVLPEGQSNSLGSCRRLQGAQEGAPGIAQLLDSGLSSQQLQRLSDSLLYWATLIRAS